jgi:hypothetical protein
MTEIKTTSRTEYIRDPRSRKWVKKVSKIAINPEDISIDEAPPPGVEGPLSKTPPQKLGGVTSAQLERSRQTHPPVRIEESLPKQDKD